MVAEPWLARCQVQDHQKAGLPKHGADAAVRARVRCRVDAGAVIEGNQGRCGVQTLGEDFWGGAGKSIRANHFDVKQARRNNPRGHA